MPELDRLASAAQYRVEDLEELTEDTSNTPNVIRISRIGLRKTKVADSRASVDAATQASRLRYISDFLEFFSGYVGATLCDAERKRLEMSTSFALKAFREHIPTVSKRAKLNARIGLSEQEQHRLLEVINPESSLNPWTRGYVRKRNWLLIVLLLASGMRRGELLGLQIGDLNAEAPKLRILRRADTEKDPRRIQPCTKTFDREIELARPVMKALWDFINNDRRAIKRARTVPQIFVSDEGAPLSHASIDKVFFQLRSVFPGLPMTLTSHVMRHTWNERFSEKAEAMGVSETVEERARNSQQGWSDNSRMAATYTRRYTAKKGREVALKLQERLDALTNKN
ncbi:hypothetical protein RGQ30_27660 [Limnobacter thiooxidans]|uniref:Tyr recombinase domain-containing protein n=1 Tax=Limnobacter thiooxidans TaxID=131080 RepID=A0AA86MFJ2_9BURK|nr:hypothetical protein RGQ30_27660 [Limnobacter thiooxidans]